MIGSELDTADGQRLPAQPPQPIRTARSRQCFMSALHLGCLRKEWQIDARRQSPRIRGFSVKDGDWTATMPRTALIFAMTVEHRHQPNPADDTALGLYRRVQHLVATAGDVHAVHCHRGLFIPGSPRRGLGRCRLLAALFPILLHQGLA